VAQAVTPRPPAATNLCSPFEKSNRRMNASGNISGYAIIALVCLALLLVLIWRWKRRSSYTFGQFFLYSVNKFFTRVRWRAQVDGSIDLPPDLGAILVSNHRAGIDPLLIQLATKRVVHWLVAREYVEHPMMGWAFRILQSIPVNRAGIDTAATKQAIRIAKNGGLVGMFPEGRINFTEDVLLPGRPGAALIALRARVPVIPCFVKDAPYDGTALGSFLMTGRAKVKIGQPIDISEFYDSESDREVQQALTKRFMSEIARLAGVENYEPKMAGKHWKPVEPVVQ
jgi:1-acyl-sn-glycerol-3-phosphate acyltransferase